MQCRDGMPWHYLGQKDGIAPTAAAALATIRAPYPLPSNDSLATVLRVISVKNTVAIQTFCAVAELTRPLLNRKSCLSSSTGPFTNIIMRFDIHPCCQSRAVWSSLLCGTEYGVTRFKEIMKKKTRHSRHFAHTQIVLVFAATAPVRHNNGTFYDGTAVRNI